MSILKILNLRKKFFNFIFLFVFVFTLLGNQHFINFHPVLFASDAPTGSDAPIQEDLTAQEVSSENSYFSLTNSEILEMLMSLNEAIHQRGRDPYGILQQTVKIIREGVEVSVRLPLPSLLMDVHSNYTDSSNGINFKSIPIYELTIEYDKDKNAFVFDGQNSRGETLVEQVLEPRENVVAYVKDDVLLAYVTESGSLNIIDLAFAGKHLGNSPIPVYKGVAYFDQSIVEGLKNNSDKLHFIQKASYIQEVQNPEEINFPLNHRGEPILTLSDLVVLDEQNGIVREHISREKIIRFIVHHAIFLIALYAQIPTLAQIDNERSRELDSQVLKRQEAILSILEPELIKKFEKDLNQSYSEFTDQDKTDLKSLKSELSQLVKTLALNDHPTESYFSHHTTINNILKSLQKNHEIGEAEMSERYSIVLSKFKILSQSIREIEKGIAKQSERRLSEFLKKSHPPSIKKIEAFKEKERERTQSEFNILVELIYVIVQIKESESLELTLQKLSKEFHYQPSSAGGDTSNSSSLKDFPSLVGYIQAVISEALMSDLEINKKLLQKVKQVQYSEKSFLGNGIQFFKDHPLFSFLIFAASLYFLPSATSLNFIESIHMSSLGSIFMHLTAMLLFYLAFTRVFMRHIPKHLILRPLSLLPKSMGGSKFRHFLTDLDESIEKDFLLNKKEDQQLVPWMRVLNYGATLYAIVFAGIYYSLASPFKILAYIKNKVQRPKPMTQKRILEPSFIIEKLDAFIDMIPQENVFLKNRMLSFKEFVEEFKNTPEVINKIFDNILPKDVMDRARKETQLDILISILFAVFYGARARLWIENASEGLHAAAPQVDDWLTTNPGHLADESLQYYIHFFAQPGRLTLNHSESNLLQKLITDLSGLYKKPHPEYLERPLTRKESFTNFLNYLIPRGETEEDDPNYKMNPGLHYSIRAVAPYKTIYITLTASTLIRLLVTDQTLNQAILGSLMFIALGIVLFGWPWIYVFINEMRTNEYLGKNKSRINALFKKLNAILDDKLASTKEIEDTLEEVKAEIKAIQTEVLSRGRGSKISSFLPFLNSLKRDQERMEGLNEILESIPTQTTVDSGQGQNQSSTHDSVSSGTETGVEQMKKSAEDLIQFLIRHPLLPTKINEDFNKSLTVVFAVGLSTYLALELALWTFDEQYLNWPFITLMILGSLAVKEAIRFFYTSKSIANLKIFKLPLKWLTGGSNGNANSNPSPKGPEVESTNLGTTEESTVVEELATVEESSPKPNGPPNNDDPCSNIIKGA